MNRSRTLPRVDVTHDDLGANSFVRKPVDFGELIETAHHVGSYWLVLNEPAPSVEHGGLQ